MRVFCQGCQREHSDFNWKFKDYIDKEGRRKSGWFCRQYFKPTAFEWVPDRIKEDRVEHAHDIVQPWREGEPSREFIKLYPDRAKKTFTEKEMRGARDVWRDVKGLRDIQETR